MVIRIFQYDIADLYWVDGTERSNLMLCFDSLADAAWAKTIWDNFILDNHRDEPIVTTLDDGSTMILNQCANLNASSLELV